MTYTKANEFVEQLLIFVVNCVSTLASLESMEALLESLGSIQQPYKVATA